MKTLRSLFHPFRGPGASGRFDRYYAGVLRPGSGYPTADEARKDMRQQSQATQHVTGWIR
ncbi:MAG: hypothetical protein ACR2OO_01845 [Thermomicrobiales bacterium]